MNAHNGQCWVYNYDIYSSRIMTWLEPVAENSPSCRKKQVLGVRQTLQKLGLELDSMVT